MLVSAMGLNTSKLIVKILIAIRYAYSNAYDYIYEFIILIMTDPSNLLGEDLMGKYSVS